MFTLDDESDLDNVLSGLWLDICIQIPDEEKDLGAHDRLIHVYHFSRDASQNHMVQNFGEPFFLVVHETETLAEVKQCIQRKLEIPYEEFSKWNFAFVSLGRPEYLQDSDVVASRFLVSGIHCH
jgi:ubiquitin carboxyl-terminal hydrolase 7